MNSKGVRFRMGLFPDGAIRGIFHSYEERCFVKHQDLVTTGKPVRLSGGGAANRIIPL
jgi:hypothetical protein